jgi:hypothetical protein
MIGNGKSCRPNIRRDRKAASPAVSMVIITAATVVLVVVSSAYALQVLTRQQAEAEFETVQNSILAFDDALRDIAWDLDGSRSVRFTTQYGNLRLINGGKNFTINAYGINGTFSYQFSTAVVEYEMPHGYGIPGGDSSYILGDDRTAVSKLTESLGQAFLEHKNGSAIITLNYRVRVSEEGPITVGLSEINYIDIFVISLKCESSAISSSDFNLVCRNIGIKTISSDVFSVTAPTGAYISVSDGTKSNSVNLDDLNLNYGENAVFNLIVSEVRVST